MKFFASILLALVLGSSLTAFAEPGLKLRPLRGGEGIPWPLGEKNPNDSWYFELAGNQYRIDIRKDRYVSGQWTYDVRLSNVTRKFTVGSGMGVYNENFYSFAIRDDEGRFYQFTTLGQGRSFNISLTVYSQTASQFFNLKTTRAIEY